MSVPTFDYIIVGAGSAGCALAHRLSASGRHSVLLLEAGPRDWNPWLHIPLGYGKLFKDPRVNWCYSTAPEPGLDGRSLYQPRGKVLGGSSAINGLVYVRGQREDFDDWRAAGNTGWGYEDVLPYFKRAERQCRGADAYHGAAGPLVVSDPAERHVLCDDFIDAVRAAGYDSNPDFNGERQQGAGYYQTTSRHGIRCSASTAYLRSARGRRNLAVRTGARVGRIRLEGRLARGVEWVEAGAARAATANCEVILAAGTFNTVQILERSGIGSAPILAAHGIKVAHDLPGVGAGLQDHLQVRAVARCSGPITTNDALRTPWGRLQSGLRYALWRRGPLAVGAGYAGAFLRTPRAAARPDVQVHFILFSTDEMGTSLHRFPGFTASVCALRPTSRGTVHISAPDANAPPLIRGNYLATEHDREITLEGLKLLRRILQTPPLRRHVAQEVDPGDHCSTDDELLAFCRARGTSLYHAAGTARMGSDALAVVDARLRVHGIGALRVADASIMPSLVSGNTNAAAIMIGEKAADLVLTDHGSGS